MEIHFKTLHDYTVCRDELVIFTVQAVYYFIIGWLRRFNFDKSLNNCQNSRILNHKEIANSEIQPSV